MALIDKVHVIQGSSIVAFGVLQISGSVASRLDAVMFALAAYHLLINLGATLYMLYMPFLTFLTATADWQVYPDSFNPNRWNLLKNSQHVLTTDTCL